MNVSDVKDAHYKCDNIILSAKIRSNAKQLTRKKISCSDREKWLYIRDQCSKIILEIKISRSVILRIEMTIKRLKYVRLLVRQLLVNHFNFNSTHSST